VSALGGRGAGDVEHSVTEFARGSNGGLISVANPVTVNNRDLIISLAARHRAIYPFRSFVAGGGLISASRSLETSLKNPRRRWRLRVLDLDPGFRRVLTDKARVMTVTRQGKWRVTVENKSMIEMGAQWEIGPVTEQFNSLDAALEFACEKRKIKDYKITVEGPDGVALDEEELARCCALANQK